MEHLREAVEADIAYIVPRMRAADVAECFAGGCSPESAMRIGFDICPTRYTLLDPTTKDPVAMLGVGPSHYPMTGMIWLLATTAIERYPKTLIRQSKRAINDLHGPYEALYNRTHVGNDLHHRWLHWLGFTFLRRVELRRDNYFYEFVRLRNR